MTGLMLVLDPGHGGSKPAGGSSPNRGSSTSGLLEKEIALDLARRTRDRLAADHVVVLTRDSDSNLPLLDRAATAKALQAAAFISLHLSGRDPTADRTDVVVARSASPASRNLAENLRRRVGAVTGAPGEVRQADLGQLAADRHDPATAAALVEIASLAVPARASQLADPAYRDLLADALAAAVRESVGSAPVSTAQWARTAEIFPPEIDYSYSIGGIVDAVGIWADWLVRRAAWEIGVPDSMLTLFPHASICQLKLYTATGDLAWGTGFYIADEVILTCGHNFYGSDPDQPGGYWETTRIEVQPGHSPRTSTFPTKSFTVNYLDHVHPRWAGSEEVGYDLAVLSVPGLPSQKGNFSLANVSLAESVGIVVSGYGKVRGSVPFEQQGQRLDGAHITSSDHELVYYPMMTKGGHSGSPVFHGTMVIGVHTGPRARSQHENRAVLLTPEKTDWIATKAGVPLTYGQSLRTTHRTLTDENSTQSEQSAQVRLNIARSVGRAEASGRYDQVHNDSGRVNFGLGSWTGSRIADLLDTYLSFAASAGITDQLLAHFGGQAGIDAIRTAFRTSGTATVLTEAQRGQLRSLGRDTVLQGAQDQHLANDVRVDLDAIGSMLDPSYPFIDGGMGAISELAAHALVHARHQAGGAGLRTLIRETIDQLGGDTKLGQDMVAGIVTERDFIGTMAERLTLRVREQYRQGVRNRYGTLMAEFGDSRLSYYFSPAN